MVINHCLIFQTEPVIGEDETLPIRFRSKDVRNKLRISEGDADDAIEIELQGDYSDEEFKVLVQDL